MGRSQHRARITALALVAACVLASAQGLRAPAAAQAAATAAPAGNALWVVRATSAAELAAKAEQAGVHTLFLKGADGTTPEAQTTPALLSELRTLGLSVCVWTFDYGVEPAGEAAAAIAAVRDGASCLVVDAEGQYDKRYGAAQAFLASLRATLGARFPIGLAGQAEVLEHPTFPYSVFLGPGGFSYDMPQLYWRDLGLSVSRAFRAALPINSIYGRPILPVGQLYGSPTPAELGEFLLLAAEYRAYGVSFFDLDSAEPDLLAALRPRARLAVLLHPVAPTIRPGADGDEVVWAQELLDGAGAHLPVGGFFGAQTARAIGAFQARHRLRVDGLLDAATWRVLMRFHAHEPSWASAPPQSAR